jgi:hypothetical protein
MEKRHNEYVQQEQEMAEAQQKKQDGQIIYKTYE